MSSPSQPLGYIHDGYVRKAIIRERKHCYPALRFEYRPILVGDRAILFKGIRESASDRQADLLSARTIAKYVVSWDLTDADGGIVKIHADHAMKMDSHLFRRLFNVLVALEETDDDPDWAASQKTDDSELDELLKETPTTIMSRENAAQEFDAKNSDAG